MLDPEERQVMDALMTVMRTITRWGLRANVNEMMAAIHVLQGFVVQHMLQRIEPEQWSRWFTDAAPKKGRDA
jgi:hypothetical protein